MTPIALASASWTFDLTGHPVLDSFISIFIVCFILINFIAVYAGVSTYAERKIAGHMQARVGPYRIGPHGFLVWIADALKLMIKEDIVATQTDKLLFKLSPYVVFAGSFACWVALPYAPNWSPASFNIGILYLLAVSSAVVIGILMAGWSSGSKWALFGAMRSAAQIVSYEVPIGITLLGMLLIYGTLDMHEISLAQQKGLPFGLYGGDGEGSLYGGLWSWGINRYPPFTIIAFIIYYIGALAETNRTPFDIPEAESELVAGYHTEYSGMRFSFFFLSEYANMFVVSAIAVTFFLGGWLPPVPSASGTLLLGVGTLVGAGAGYVVARRGFDSFVGAMLGSGLAALLAVFVAQPDSDAVFTGKGAQILVGAFWFFSKCFVLIFFMIWLRWTLPRYRVDQLMDLCWKKLTPLALINLVAIGLLETRHEWMALLRGGPK